MKLAAFNLLKKLMPMTRSDADAEALMAIRKANKLLDEAGTNWENVFARLVKVEDEIEPAPEEWTRAPDAAGRRRYLGDLIEDVAANASGDFVDFVESVREQFERTGMLSVGQIEALEKSRARARRDEHDGSRRRWS